MGKLSKLTKRHEPSPTIETPRDDYYQGLANDAFLRHHVVKRSANGDNVNDFMNRMEIFARISNGAALEVDLAEGTMKAEEVVAELLHMGSLSTTEIVNIDVGTLNTAMDALEDLPGKFDNSEAIKDGEELLLAMERVKEALSKLTDANNLPGKKKFLDALKAAQKVNDTDIVTPVKKLIVSVNAFKDVINKHETWTSDTDPNEAASDNALLNVLLTSMNKFETEQAKFPKDLNKFKGIEDLGSGPNVLKPIKDENELHKAYNDLSDKVKDVNQVIQNFKVFEDVAGSFKKAQVPLKSIQTLVHNRLDSRSNPKKFTPGFPNGINDLDELSRDTDNKWLQSNIAGKEKTTTNIDSTFLIMEDFKKDLRNVENAWRVTTDTATTVVIDQTISAQLAIVRLSDNGKSVIAIATELLKCHADKPDLAGFVKFSGLLDAVLDFNKMVDNLSQIEHIEPIKNLDVLKNAITFPDGLNNAQKEEKTREIVGKLKKMPEVNGIIESLNSLSDQLTGFTKSVTNIPVKATELLAEFSNVDNYLAKMSAEYRNFNGCLNKAIGADGAKVSGVIREIQKIRDDKADSMISRALMIVEDIKSSADGLKVVLETARQFTKHKNYVAQLKTSFPNALDAARGLGMIVEEMSRIKNFRDNRKRLNALMTINPDVIQKAASDNQSGLKTHYDELLKFKKLQNDLKSVYVEIDKVIGSVDNLPDVAFSKSGMYKAVFDNAAAIQFAATPATLKEAVRAVIRLDRNLNGKFFPLIKSLETLETMNSDFDSFQSTTAVDSLSKIDKFFNEFAKHSVQPPASTIGGTPPRLKDTLMAAVPTTEGTNFFSSNYLIPSVLVSFLLGLAAALFCAYLIQRHRWIGAETQEIGCQTDWCSPGHHPADCSKQSRVSMASPAQSKAAQVKRSRRCSRSAEVGVIDRTHVIFNREFLPSNAQPFYHANMVEFGVEPNIQKYIICQSPQEDSTVRFRKTCNVPQFWALQYQNETRVIIDASLRNDRDCARYLPEKGTPFTAGILNVALDDQKMLVYYGQAFLKTVVRLRIQNREESREIIVIRPQKKVTRVDSKIAAIGLCAHMVIQWLTKEKYLSMYYYELKYWIQQLLSGQYQNEESSRAELKADNQACLKTAWECYVDSLRKRHRKSYDGKAEKEREIAELSETELDELEFEHEHLTLAAGFQQVLTLIAQVLSLFFFNTFYPLFTTQHDVDTNYMLHGSLTYIWLYFMLSVVILCPADWSRKKHMLLLGLVISCVILSGVVVPIVAKIMGYDTLILIILCEATALVYIYPTVIVALMLWKPGRHPFWRLFAIYHRVGLADEDGNITEAGRKWEAEGCGFLETLPEGTPDSLIGSPSATKKTATTTGNTTASTMRSSGGTEEIDALV
ncbi:unnamed protein product [Caenorhabditis sp. 36 PRJEB53466]|nr:unnamed protein product [Caenorhabditis sp. 36 PRJEB53466]